MNAQRHTNTFRSHPLDRLYLDFTLVCVLQKNATATGRYCRIGTTTTDAITTAVAGYCRCYHHHDSNSWLASSDIDRYFQLLPCPFSRPLLRTCSRVHETICTVFNVIFQSRPLLLSRFPFRLFVSSHGASLTREEKRNIRSAGESNSYMIGPFSIVLCKEQNTSSVYLFASFMPL